MLSIIIPVYNCEMFISKCIKSILNQKGNFDYEIILIDDGSTDRTAEICKEFIKFSKVKYYRQDNQGVSAARNKGIEVSSGEFIMFVDSDDYIDENTLENVLYQIYDCDIVIFNKVFIKKRNVKYNVLYKKNLIVRSNQDKDLFKLDLLTYNFDNLMNKVNFLSCGCTAKIFRKDILKNVKFIEGCKYGEDVLFNLNAYDNANKIKYINFNGYYFNINDNSSTHKFRTDWIDIQDYFLEKLQDVIFNKYSTDYRYLDAFYFTAFTRIYSLIKNYYFHKEYKKCKKVRYKELKKHLENEIYGDSIKYVKFKFLNFKQKIFYIIIKLHLLKFFCYLAY